MTSEIIKALTMITLFCGLQASLHLPRLINSRTVKCWREAILAHRRPVGAHAPISHALIRVRVRRNRR